MNTSTGIYRLAQVIKWAGRLLTGGIVAMIATHPADQIIWPTAVALVLWGVSAAIAWVLEGFAKG